MATRRSIQPAEATALIKSAARHGTSVERVVFPAMTYRAAGLMGVTFIDCDVGRLSFAGPWFRSRSFELVDCAFVSCDGSSHFRYRDLEFGHCRWEHTELSGSWKSVRMRDCSFVDTAISDLKIERSRIQSTLVEGLAGSGLTIHDSELEGVRIAGSIRHLSLVDIRVNDLDLSALEVIDGGYLGIVGSAMMLRDFPKSIAIRSQESANPSIGWPKQNPLKCWLQCETYSVVRLNSSTSITCGLTRPATTAVG